MYDLSQHFQPQRYQQQHRQQPNLHAYAKNYQQQNRPHARMRQNAQQMEPENVRREHQEEEEEISRERMSRLQQLRQRAARTKKSRHFVYSTYKEGGKTYIAFERPAFITLVLLLSIGIGILAVDARKFIHFLAHTIRKSLSAVTS